MANKKKFVPRLQHLLHNVVIPRYDKKHRVCFDAIDGAPQLYLSKFTTDVKAGIPSRITNIIDCKSHAYIMIEPAKFTFPSEIQIVKFLASVYKNNITGTINPVVSSLGDVIEITYLNAGMKLPKRFIIGMAFGTLWKIPYADYRKHIPKDFDGTNAVSFDTYLTDWYRKHPTKMPTVDDVREYILANGLSEKYASAKVYFEYHPISDCGYATILGDEDLKTIDLAFENPCVVYPYRNNLVCASLVGDAKFNDRPTCIGTCSVGSLFD